MVKSQSRLLNRFVDVLNVLIIDRFNVVWHSCLRARRAGQDARGWDGRAVNTYTNQYNQYNQYILISFHI